MSHSRARVKLLDKLVDLATDGVITDVAYTFLMAAAASVQGVRRGVEELLCEQCGVWVLVAGRRWIYNGWLAGYTGTLYTAHSQKFWLGIWSNSN